MADRRVARMLNKVPEVTLVFWIIKILATTVGETGSDYLAVHVGLGTLITGLITLVLLMVSLSSQFCARCYIPWRYWLTVVLISVVGTQITDFLTDRLNVSLYVSTAVFSIALAATFILWYRAEKTLSIHSIFTRRREMFYWTAILFTFALGTAAGDLATDALQLGFQLGVVIFGGLIVLTTIAYKLGANPVLTFWIAYVLTRPLGASIGDLLSQPHDAGGLGVGTVVTSAAFLGVIVSLVGFLTVTCRQPQAALRDGALVSPNRTHEGPIRGPYRESVQPHTRWSNHVRVVSGRDLMSKVPAITLFFWIIKIAATMLGETGGDTVTMTLNWGYLAGSGLFLVVLSCWSRRRSARDRSTPHSIGRPSSHRRPWVPRLPILPIARLASATREDRRCYSPASWSRSRHGAWWRAGFPPR